MYLLFFIVFFITNNCLNKIIKIKNIKNLNKTIEKYDYLIIYAYDKKIIKNNNMSKNKHISLINSLKKINGHKNIINSTKSIKIGKINTNKIKNFNCFYFMPNEFVLYFFYKGNFINQASLLGETDLNKLKQLLYKIYETNSSIKKRWNKKTRKNSAKNIQNCCNSRNYSLNLKIEKYKKIKSNKKNNIQTSLLFLAPSYNYEYGGDIWGPWLNCPGWAPYTGFGSWSYAPINPKFGSTITFPL
jgi:hypothetical protein